MPWRGNIYDSYNIIDTGYFQWFVRIDFYENALFINHRYEGLLVVKQWKQGIRKPHIM